ncbi:glycerol-3-phosphate dehydrogenase [Thermosulfidibacter takaii ABI70S6]|uniref:Glycerol-3-phosphate dehydrogenase n=1 Tax=Thermosulfidibacter takaii (strain DSM 17441 / JCM 13301 / NBRC 103674 / ABI70S6) TaxID=1298851 RepID=A0A0S3QS76_THET7|nr:glycerol-3-phosphate dehydrogenase/oxidase [Thermosulfidibacter takaii]BAT71165.1 glycerol-3-phosphate dehydrogenase [Thermosulfidibacter takaii ABI70S6]
MRQIMLEEIERDPVFDVVVIGGGITGAGIFRRSALLGFRTLLVEQKDFAWGTSSRSGKLVHGGLRYIKQGQLNITYHSVREREKLLKIYPLLVKSLRFTIPVRKNKLANKVLYKIGLTVYDLFAFKRTYSFQKEPCSPLIRNDVEGCYTFQDAITDDARLTLHVIKEGIFHGGIAVNYTEAMFLDRSSSPKTLILKERTKGKELEVKTRAIIIASGAWSDYWDPTLPLRKLRGSHLVISSQKLPLETAVALIHPEDRRPLYAMPWMGHTLVGTTDLDHLESLKREPKITEEEVNYLLDAIKFWFPEVKLTKEDIISTFSGIRAVMYTGKKDPSKETRDYIIKRLDEGIILVTGGKLTTFDYIARKILKELKPLLTSPQEKKIVAIDFNPPETDSIENILYSTKEEMCVHLEDVMIRRTRLGLIRKDRGLPLLEECKPKLKKIMNWSESEWQQEMRNYVKTLQNYSLPQ